MRWRNWVPAVWWATLVCIPVMWAQPNALLSNREAVQLYGRSVQLMESAAVAVPELSRAGAPVMENARQALLNLESADPLNAAFTHTFLLNLRTFVTLSDAVPKPFPFPEEARAQLVELREGMVRIEAHFHALLERKEDQLRSPDRDNLARYKEANERLGPPQAGKPRVVFLGDSITDRWRLNEYFPESDFLNRGISGQITGEILGRMKADVIDLKPQAVLVLAGTNDISRGVPLDVIQNNLTMIAELAVANQIKPIFASLLPVSDYHKDQNPQYEQSKRRPPATILALNQWLRQFCRVRKFAYVDYFPKMVDSAAFLRADLADDGLHPNASGYRIMAPIALEAITNSVAPESTQTPRKKFLIF